MAGRFQPGRNRQTGSSAEQVQPVQLADPAAFQQLSLELPRTVNEILEQNHKSLVYAALKQYTLAQLVQSDEWRAQVSDPATALQKFAILFNNSQEINWPKTANYVRFFPGCWGGVVKGAAALSDDELRTLISECLKLTTRACTIQLSSLSKEIFNRILSASVTASYRTLEAKNYILLDYMVQRVNMQSYIRQQSDEQDGAVNEADPHAAMLAKQEILKNMILSSESIMFERTGDTTYRTSTVGGLFYKSIALKNNISPDNMMSVVNSVVQLLFGCPAPPEVLRCERTMDAVFVEGQILLEKALMHTISGCLGSGCCVISDDTKSLGEEKKCVEVSFLKEGGKVEVRTLALITVASKKVRMCNTEESTGILVGYNVYNISAYKYIYVCM
jgi:hypothetical protein